MAFQKNTIGVVSLAGGHLLVDFYGAIVISVAPFLALHMGLTLSELGLLTTITTIITSFAQPVFGHFVDKYPSRTLLPISVGLAGIFACVIGLFPSYFFIIILNLMAGMAVSLYHPLGSQLSNLLSPGREGWAMSIYSLGGNLGLTIAPLLAMPLVEHYGLQSLMWLIIPGILWILVCKRKIYTASVVKPVFPEHVTSAVREMHAAAGGLWRIIIRLNIVTGLRSWTHTALVIYMPTVYVLTGHSKIEAARYLSVFLAAGVLGGLFAGWLADHCQKRWIIVVSNAISMCAVAMFILSDGIWELIFWIIAGASLQGIIPVTVVMAQGYLPGNMAMASGMMMGFAFGIGSLGALLTGLFADVFSLHFALWVLVFSMGVALGFSIFLPEPLKRE